MFLDEARCARLWVEKARGVTPEDDRVAEGLARLEKAEGNLDRAADLQEKLLDNALADGDDWTALDVRFAAVDLAEVRLQQGRFAETAELYEKVYPTLQEKLSRNDNFNIPRFLDMAWAYRNLEQTQQEQAALAEARRRIQDARDGGISTWLIDFSAALLSAQTGDKEAAEVYFQKAVNLGFVPVGNLKDSSKRLGELLQYSDAYRAALAKSEERLASLKEKAAPNIQLAIERAQM